MILEKHIRRMALLAVLTLSCSAAWAARTLYLNTGGTSLWGTSSPDFYVYAFNSSANESYKKMTKVEGNIYSATIDDTKYSTVIFVRHNPSCTSFSWDCKWNQTDDLTLPSGGQNYYQITGWDKSGYWTTYTPPTFYTVSVTNGTASATSVAEGGSVTLTANAAANCKQFASWNITGATVSDLTVTPLTISKVSGNITAEATYTDIALPTSISLELSATTIYKGKSVTVTPTPSPTVSGISYTYQYKKKDASDWTTASSASITLSEIGTYAVRVVGKVSGCTTEITSSEATVTVEALPRVMIHVKFPSAWFNSYSTPAVWYWKTNGNGTEGVMTYEFDDTDGGKWYKFGIPGENDKFLLKPQGGWSWQTNDMTTPSAETCYKVVTTNKQNATVIDCVIPPTFYTVSVTNGTASATSVAEGGSVTLTANAAANCKQFASWNITGATVSDLTVTPLTISKVSGNITAEATYTDIALPTSISLELSATTIYKGKSVTVTPTPSPTVSGISYTYQYKKKDASDWTTASSASITLSEIGTYAVRVVGKVSGCTTEIISSEATVTVEAIPDVTIRGNFPAEWFTENSGYTPYIYWWVGDGKTTDAFEAMTYEMTDSDGSLWYVLSLTGDAEKFKFCRSEDSEGYHWGWQNSNNLTRPEADACYQLSATTNQTATVRACPQATLSVSSSEGTSFVAGTTTTLTAATNNFTGDITYTISIGGEQVSRKNSYSWTPAAAGTYTVVFTASNGTTTLTESLEIKVMAAVTVYFRRPKGTEGFGKIDGWTQSTPELYVASTYTSGEYYFSLFTKYTMSHYVTDDDKYEWFVAYNIPEGKQIFFFDGNDSHKYDGRSYYNASTVLVQAAATCYTIEKQEREDPNRFVLTAGNCPQISGRYRLRSATTDGRTFYSNVGTLADTLSVYVAGTLWLEKYNNDNHAWGDSLQLQLSDALDSMLIIATYANNAFSVAPYVGDIYVRTDGANGGWTNYICDDNRMTNWAPNRTLASEYYDYYWLRWIEQNKNLKATVANRFNPSIANELGDFILSSAGANTRFAYDAPSNRFYRNMIGGAGTEKFLEVTEMKVGDQHLIYTDENKSDPIGYHGENGKILSDVSNWNYYIDTYCYPGAAIHMEGTQANAGTQVLVDSLVVLRGETFPEKPYRVRLIYLFAQNRIVHAWLPDGEYDDDYDIGSGVLFVRQDDELQNRLTMSETAGAKVIADRIYMCFELNKENWKQKRAVKQQVYFFSLPYTCAISDIYGSFDLTDYGTKWIIQRYRGDLRAKNGLVAGSTYWKNMTPTATLEANRGYVLCTNFEESDFKDASGVSRLRLYFPSVGTDFTFEYQKGTTTTLDEYPCTINIPDERLEYGNGDRRQLDNNWHVIGVPGFVPMKVNALDATALQYVYKYTMRSSSESTTSSQYALCSTADGFVMEPFYSYFVQYAGEITWSAYTSVSPNNAPAALRAATHTTSAMERYPLTVTHTSGAEDRMYVTLSDDGTTEFTSNRDVLKMLTTGHDFPQMYARFGKENLAAIDLPNATQTIALGLYFGQAGEYTIALSGNATQQAEKVLLYDKVRNQYCDLLQGDYTFEAAVGTDDTRFELTISKKSGVVTEQPTTTASAVELFGLDGRLQAVNLAAGDRVRLYDAVGRLVADECAVDGRVIFDALQAGIYVVTIEMADQIVSQKVIVK